MALLERPPPLWALSPLRWRWPPDCAAARGRSDRAARWPPPCATALVLALLRLEAPRTLCFFTSRAGLGALNALLGFAVAACAPGRLCAGFAAFALARVGLDVVRALAPAWR